ncbi:hypothetical protein D3C78_1522660 [compost metagenome]
MGRVVNHPQVVVVGDFLDSFDITGVAIAMHRHYGGSVRRNRCLDPGWVEVEGMRIDIREYRLDTVPQQRVCGSHEGIRRGDDFTGHTQCL